MWWRMAGEGGQLAPADGCEAAEDTADTRQWAGAHTPHSTVALGMGPHK